MNSKIILLILFLALAFCLFSNDTPHSVVVYLEDATGNYPSSSEITFSATLKDDSASEDVVGTITNSDSPTSKYISADGVLLIECSNYSTWDSGYFLEITIIYGGSETIFLNQTGNTTPYDDGYYDRIELDNENYQVYDGFSGTPYGDYTSYIFGIPADDVQDVAGKVVTLTEVNSDFTGSRVFNCLTGVPPVRDDLGNIAVKATVTYDVNPEQIITVKQYDDQRQTIPAFGSTLPISFDVVYELADINYSTNNTVYTFNWDYDLGVAGTISGIKAAYTINNGELWNSITTTAGDVTITDSDYSGVDGSTVGTKQYGIEITITGNIHNVVPPVRAHTNSDLSFAFGIGDNADLLAISVPTGLAGSVDTSIFGDYDYYLSWDPVAGATSYLVEEYKASTNTWGAAVGTYQTLIQSFQFEFSNEERIDSYRVKAVSTTYGETGTDPSTVFGLHDYYVQQIYESNNNLFVVPVVNNYSTDPETFAKEIDCCDAIAQWDGDSWEECYYSNHLGQWINTSSFTLDFTEPILINAISEKNLFFGGAITDDIQYTFDYSSTTSDYYITIPGDFTTTGTIGEITTNNTIEQLIADMLVQGITVSKVYRFVNSNKNWYEMEDTDTFYPGQLIKVTIFSGSGSWPDRSGRAGGNQLEIGSADLYIGGVK